MTVRSLPTIPSSNPYPSPQPTPTTAPPPTSPNPNPHPHASGSIPSDQPPEYHSVPGAVPRRTQIDSTAEKQALRDAQRRMDEELAANRGHLSPSRMPPPSINPGSTAPVSDESSGNTGSRGTGTGAGAGSGTGTGTGTNSGSSRPRQSQDEAEDAYQERDDGLEIGHRGYLPPGLDVRDALARCEDPTLGWSLQFWVTIADPLTQHVFFACPASGQCSWDPPVGAFVVPRSPDGEWWELADSTRNNRSYYYNTLTGKTQWTRPGGNAFVIPLGLIQRNALPARPTPNRQSSTPNAPSSSHLAPSTPSRDRAQTYQHSPARTPKRQGIPRPLNSPAGSVFIASPTGSTSGTYQQSPSQALEAIVLGQFSSSPTQTASPEASPTKAAHTSNGSIPHSGTQRSILAVVEEGSGSEADRSDNSGGVGWWEKRRSKALGAKKVGSPKKAGRMLRTISVERLNANGHADEDALQRGSPLKKKHSINSPIAMVDDESAPNGLPKDMPLEPIYVEQPGSVRTKRMSTGLHPLLPTDISSAIQNFQADDFSRKYFATKRTGVFRQRVPVSRIMEWQRQPITAPLLVLSRNLSKDAVTTFKVIQHVMGERDRSVDAARPTQAGSSLNLAGLALGANGRRADEGRPGFAGGEEGGGSGRRSEKMVVLEEIRWMIQLCVAAGEMRDEVYSQLIKQLTKNPDHDAVVLGFQLFCVLVNSFGPSKNFEPFVNTFLQRNVNEGSDGIGVMAKYSMGKIDVMANKGGRAKALTVGEIEHASDAAFYPSVYGESLVRIMELQRKSYPQLQVPVILPFLADGILALGGLHSEGIFRVPGDGDSVAELKSRMDRGHYQLKGIDDPHVAASLFKLWLRELEEPIIPTSMYNDALIASRSARECLEIVQRLPTYNRRVLLFVISFVQMFADPKVVEVTKMGPMNLALVMAPNILRTTSDSLVTVFTNSSFESKFILQLVENVRPGQVDPDFVPTHGQPARLTEGVV
ncbi:hypothetical protein IAT38_008057 [Cryptococcus sp. DSM 104549]